MLSGAREEASGRQFTTRHVEHSVRNIDAGHAHHTGMPGQSPQRKTRSRRHVALVAHGTGADEPSHFTC